MPRSRRPAKKQVTRSERRRSREARKGLWLLLGAAALSALILVAWFPASALYGQRTDLAETNSQLAQVRQQNAALSQEHKNLSNPAEVGRIAREQYQLVSPGQQAFEVLPPSGSAQTTAPSADDPGTGASGIPSASTQLPSGAVTATTQPASGAGRSRTGAAVRSGTAQAQGTVARIVQALEFWR